MYAHSAVELLWVFGTALCAAIGWHLGRWACTKVLK